MSCPDSGGCISVSHNPTGDKCKKELDKSPLTSSQYSISSSFSNSSKSEKSNTCATVESQSWCGVEFLYQKLRQRNLLIRFQRLIPIFPIQHQIFISVSILGKEKTQCSVVLAWRGKKQKEKGLIDPENNRQQINKQEVVFNVKQYHKKVF